MVTADDDADAHSLSTLPSPSPSLGHVSHILLDAELYVAVASGCRLWITSVDRDAVLQVLGPLGATVSCTSFCHQSAKLAVAAGDVVTVFVTERRTQAEAHGRWRLDADLQQEGPVLSLAWATAPASGAAGRTSTGDLQPCVLWVGGPTLSRWSQPSCGGAWSRTWSRTLSQPSAHAVRW